MGYFVPRFCISVRFVEDFTVRMALSTVSARVLSGVPGCGKVVMGLTEKIRVSDKLPSGMN